MEEAITTDGEITTQFFDDSHVVLKLDAESVYTLNGETKILNLDSEDFNAFQSILKDLTCKNFPKAFFISINIKQDYANLNDACKLFISARFNDSRSLLVQINSKLFYKKKDTEVFKDFEIILKENEIQKKLKEITDFLVTREHFDIFVEIKETLSSYYEELFPNGYNILREIDELHDNIKNGSLEKVKEFANNNADFRLCYGNQKVCALQHAIDCKQFKIFSFLRANNFYTDKGKELEEKIKMLSETRKHEIRIENLKYTKEYPNAFIGVLLSKCKFDACSPVSSNAVQKMLTELCQIDELRPFLKVAAEADFKIIFDFATKSVKNMDPNCDEHTMGMAYFDRGELYVGRDQDKLSRYGTFMHELTHMVLFLIYENECLPYCEGDRQRETEWDEIVKAERENYFLNQGNIEPIIRWVFQCYDEGWEQLAELAVRPNHMMARYLENPRILGELRQTHSEIFNYVHNYVLPDLCVPNVLQIISLNNRFEVINKIESSKLQLKPCDENLEIVINFNEKIVLTSKIPYLVLSKLHQEITSSSSNKLYSKVKNIYVDVERLNILSFKHEFESLLETSDPTSDIDRVILHLSEARCVDNAIEYLTTFKCDSKIIVVCDDATADRIVNDLQYEKISIDFEFENLTDKSKETVLERQINFQGLKSKVSDFLTEIPNDSLVTLCSAQNVSINVNEIIKLENFMSRVLVRNSLELDFDEFMNSIQYDQIVILSDCAGSGKTTLLRKTQENLLKEFPTFWISFVCLREFIEELSKDLSDSFEKVFIKILNLNSIERDIFAQKFSKGEVKILFDGFDEISPRCKDETLKLFKRFKAQDENQIFITTRTHLEHDLEKELIVESFKIKPLTDDNQIQFLCNFWKDSHQDKNLIKFCAQQLVKKISEILKGYPNLIGIPIILQSVARLYVSKINENFLHVIKNLKLSKVYVKIFEDCLSISNKNQPSNVAKHLSPLQVHEYFAIVYFFGKYFATELGLIYDPVEYPLEEIARYGILTYDRNERIFFNHLTYAEHLLSNFMTSIFINFKKLSKIHLNLLHKILNDDKFAISQTFINDNLENLHGKNFKITSNDKNRKILKLAQEKKLTNLSKILVLSEQQDNGNGHELNLDDVSSMSDTEIEQFRDHRGYDILMLASEAGRLDVVQDLIIRNVSNVDFELDDEKAASVAYKRGHDEIVLVLLKANSRYPSNFDFENPRDTFNEFLNLIHEIHEKVRTANKENVHDVKIFIKQKIEENPKMTYFYDTDNRSLVPHAILWKQFDLYEFLLSLDLSIGSNESMWEINEQLTNNEREELSDINFRISPSILSEVMVILMKNSKLSPDSPKHRQGEFMYLIHQAYYDLMKIPEIAIVLQIVAASRNFRIVVDFKRDYVDFLDPKSGPYCGSLMYASGKIFIGAKDLLSVETAHRVVGQIAHELTSYAMFLVYDNLAKPYKEKDKINEARFSMISEYCKSVKNFDAIVRLDCYDEDMHHAELIVRVPHVIAFYKYYPDLLKERRETYKPLFDFYEEICMPEMEAALPKIEEKFSPFKKSKEWWRFF